MTDFPRAATRGHGGDVRDSFDKRQKAKMVRPVANEDERDMVAQAGETTRWDVADHLDNEEMILAYLEAVFEDGHPELIAAALNDVARARGAVDPALTGGTGIDRVIAAMKSLGLELTARAA